MSDCSSVRCSSHDVKQACRQNQSIECVVTKYVEIGDKETSHSSTGTSKVFRTRFIYNSHVQPANIEAALACRLKRDSNTKKVLVKSQMF